MKRKNNIIALSLFLLMVVFTAEFVSAYGNRYCVVDDSEITYGTKYSGAYSDLMSDNDVYYRIDSTTSGFDRYVQILFLFDNSTGKPDYIRIDLELDDTSETSFLVRVIYSDDYEEDWFGFEESDCPMTIQKGVHWTDTGTLKGVEFYMETDWWDSFSVDFDCVLGVDEYPYN